MSTSPHDGSVTVVFNVGRESHLYTYDSELEKQAATFALPRIVRDLCWSPDGGKLAVLFNGRYDENRKPVGVGFWDTSHEPDVWIVDPHSGQALVKFWTGSNQSRIAFSKDGKRIYVINDSYYSYPKHKGAIRVFSAVTGDPVQTISAGARGVHDNFILSTDGKVIAADASTEIPQGLRWEPVWGAKIARVVLIDARTGELLFEHHEKTDMEVSDPLPLAFSADGRFLFVDFPLTKKEPYEHIEVFSLDTVAESEN